jgi:hypothetical protein
MQRACLITLHCLLISGSFFAQQQDSVRTFFAGLFVSPDYSRGWVPNATDIYRFKPAFTAGLEFKLQLNRGTRVSLGIQYSKKGALTEEWQLYSYDWMAPERTPKYMYYNTTAEFIDLPARIEFRLLNKKISPLITTGISTNILLRGNTTEHITYFDGTTGMQVAPFGSTTKGVRRVNPQFQIGIGMDVRIGRSLLQVLPMFRFSVLSADDDAHGYYYYSVGLGICYAFRI